MTTTDAPPRTLAQARHAYFVTGKPGTYRAICACGEFESAPKRTSPEAVRAGAAHGRAARASAARAAKALAAANRSDFTTAT